MGIHGQEGVFLRNEVGISFRASKGGRAENEGAGDAAPQVMWSEFIYSSGRTTPIGQAPGTKTLRMSRGKSGEIFGKASPFPRPPRLTKAH